MNFSLAYPFVESVPTLGQVRVSGNEKVSMRKLMLKEAGRKQMVESMIIAGDGAVVQ